MFTGDPSGRFLVRALYDAGFANQPISESMGDGLVYEDCYVTAVVKCAPPGDRPTPGELANCSAYLEDEIVFMKNLRAVLALGAFAFGAYLDHLKGRGVPVKGLLFRHGGRYAVEGSPTLYASFHPSPRNTNTGKLSHRMLVDVLKGISRDLARHG